MSARFVVQTSLVFVLLLAVMALAMRMLARSSPFALDLSGRDPSTLSAETTSFLQTLEENVDFTYFVTGRDRMPSHFKEVEGSVRRLLAAIRAASPQHITYRVIDPELGGDAAIGYAARRRASAIKVRSIVEDEHSERAIWSSIVAAYGDYGEVLLQGIRPEDLPYLQEQVIESLRAQRAPPRPTFGVVDHPRFQLLPRLLEQYGTVLRLDLASRADIPRAIDVLFWMSPEKLTDRHIQELHRFLDSGRTIVLGGSAYDLELVRPAGGEPRYRVVERPSWDELLAEFGLRAVPDLLVDTTGGFVMVEAPADSAASRGLERHHAPFFLRCLPAHYNLKSFKGAARGALSFIGAAPLELRPERLRSSGFAAEVVATTSEHAAVLPLPAGSFALEELDAALPVPKQNLAVLLTPDDHWRGQLLVLGSASLFRDGILEQEGYAHRVFLRTLARTFGDPERLVRIRVSRPAAPALPPLAAGTRAFWRLLVIGLAPAVLIILGLRRHPRILERHREPRQQAGRRRWLPLLVPWVTLLALVLIGPRLWGGHAGPRLDLTEDRRHTLSAATRAALGRHRASLRLELIMTPRAAMPAPLKEVEARVRDLVRLTPWQLTTVRPDELDEAARRRLHRAGLTPFPVSTVRDDSLTSVPAWSGLRLRWGDRTATVRRIDEHSIEHLEFLLVTALQRLEDGGAPVVAVISDTPRLSPAEAYEDYQSQGLIPPAGTDVYSQLKALLEDYGYEVVHLDPRAPVPPARVDLLLWLQPRRDSSAALEMLADHLAAGGKAIVALQHFNIQQRQYRGAGFKTVYWPQPQFQDLGPYLELIGIEQMREVLMDRTRATLELPTQVNRSAHREYDRQQVALPFLIRTVPAYYASGQPVTANLGDLLFVWGNRFRVDEDRLSAIGLEARTLVTTSPETWWFDWKGGWLPEAALQPSTEGGGRQPLMLRVSGRFPPIAMTSDAQGRKVPLLAGERQRTVDRGTRSGELLLIGCSEMFKNDHLHAPGYDHSQLLLNAVADLAYEDDALLELQAKQMTARGFPYQPPRVTRRWRAFVLGTGPLILMLVGWWRARRGRRPAAIQGRRPAAIP